MENIQPSSGDATRKSSQTPTVNNMTAMTKVLAVFSICVTL